MRKVLQGIGFATLLIAMAVAVVLIWAYLLHQFRDDISEAVAKRVVQHDRLSLCDAYHTWRAVAHEIVAQMEEVCR